MCIRDSSGRALRICTEPRLVGARLHTLAVKAGKASKAIRPPKIGNDHEESQMTALDTREGILAETFRQLQDRMPNEANALEAVHQVVLGLFDPLGDLNLLLAS